MDLNAFKQRVVSNLNRMIDSSDGVEINKSLEIKGDGKYIACRRVIIDGVDLKQIPKGSKTVSKQSLMPVVKLGDLNQ